MYARSSGSVVSILRYVLSEYYTPWSQIQMADRVITSHSRNSCVNTQQSSKSVLSLSRSKKTCSTRDRLRWPMCRAREEFGLGRHYRCKRLDLPCVSSCIGWQLYRLAGAPADTAYRAAAAARDKTKKHY